MSDVRFVEFASKNRLFGAEYLLAMKVWEAALASGEAERDALRADAERYRWLKEGAEITFREQQSWPLENGKLIYSCCPSWDEYDKAIDAAIAAKEPNRD